MRTVVWSRDALDDVKSVVHYISQDKGAFALTIADRLEESAARLGTLATGRVGRVAGTYEKQVGDLPYTLAYAIDARPDGTEQIVILRVIHNARNWSQSTWPE